MDESSTKITEDRLAAITGLNSIEQLTSEYERIIKEQQELLQNKLKSVFVQIFDAFPEINEIYWTQYTPHFNDGEECIFGVNEMVYLPVGWQSQDFYDMWDLEYEMKSCSDGRRTWDGNEIKVFNQLSSYLAKIPNDVYLAAFGDHAKVSVTRQGIEVSEYEHD